MRSVRALLAGLLAVAPVTVGACSDGGDPTAAPDDATPGTDAPTDDVDAPGAGAPATGATDTTLLADAPKPVPAGAAIELDASVDRRIPAGPVTWRIEVTNTSDAPVTVTFPTGQPGDAVLLDGDVEVHRWSSGRFFTQEVTTRTLAPDEVTEVEFPDDLSAIEPGTYTLQLHVSVVGPPEPFEQSVRITAP